MPENTAILIRTMPVGPRQRGNWKLYKMIPPLDGNEYVVASAADVPCSGPETYLFAATEDGEITSWSELYGSYKGGLDHNEAIRNAGYEVADCDQS